MLRIFRGYMPKEKSIKTFQFSLLVSSKTTILCYFVPWIFYKLTSPVCNVNSITGNTGGNVE